MKVDLDNIYFNSYYYDKDEIKNIEQSFWDGTTGKIFICGDCDIFAYALKCKRNDYDLCVIKGKNSIHYFCKKNEKYIDAQGVFDSLDELLKGIPNFISCQKKHNVINDYTPDEGELWTKTALNFANEIIKSYDFIYLLVG